MGESLGVVRGAAQSDLEQTGWRKSEVTPQSEIPTGSVDTEQLGFVPRNSVPCILAAADLPGTDTLEEDFQNQCQE